MLLSYDDYARLSGDTDHAPGDVEVAIADAVAMLEDALNRDLESAERTEVVRVTASGWAFPRATPITSVASGGQLGNAGGLRNVTWALEGPVSLDEWPSRYDSSYGATQATTVVTYTGGWTAETLPARLRRAIMLLAKALLANPGSWEHPGAASRTVGDVSLVIGVSAVSVGEQIDALVPGLWRTIRGFRRRTL